MAYLELFIIAFAVSFLWMGLLWVISLKIKNAAIVDVGWGASILFYCLVYFFNDSAINAKEFLILIAVGIWSSRLSSYLFFERILGHEEEGRYKKLREYFKTNISFKMFWFFQSQALFNGFLSIPFLIIALNSDGTVRLLDIIAFLVSLAGIWGETLSDDQLKQFKSNPSNKGKVCEVGLWGYSRHPNYFFESLIWIGYAMFGMSEAYGVLGLIAPMLILYTLLKFTGIPATEEQAVRSKGDLYRDYQRRVSAFIPWIPKK